jgi:hypothetical protein
MNPSKGHLVKWLEMVPAELRSGYELVPNELERAAEKKLAGRNEATVSLTSGGKLSRWAAKKRKEKMAKESRRKNRGR